MRPLLCLLLAIWFLPEWALAWPAPPADSAAGRRVPRFPTTRPRFLVDMASASATPYLYRAPAKDDDQGYLGTTLTYQTRWGLFGSMYLNHSYGDDLVFNDVEASLGLQSVTNGSTDWSFQYTRLFVPDGSTLVKGSLTGDLNAAVGHDFDIVYAGLTADWLMGGSTQDVALNLDLSHHFSLPVLAHDTLSIEPTAELGTGSQRFYATSLARTIRRQQQVQVVKNGHTTTQTQTIEEVKEPKTPAFAVLGYTFSAPITLDTPRYSFAVIPSYLVPLHVPKRGVDDKLLYVTLELTRRFW